MFPVPNPVGYSPHFIDSSPQEYPFLQPPPPPSFRSTLLITPIYDHARAPAPGPPSFPVPAASGRSTLPITPTYDHAPHLSGYDPSFPVPAVPAGPPYLQRGSAPGRSTLPITPTYDHAPRNPSFPGSAVPVRHPRTNWGLPPPPAPPPIVHRAAAPVHSNTTSSPPYEMDPPNAMPSPSRLGVVGGPQPPAQEWSYRASTAAEFPLPDC